MESKKYLLMSSVGDRKFTNHSSLECDKDAANILDVWAKPEREYDICICYYGNTQNKYQEYKNSNKIDYYFEIKGSKFQNFYYLWNNHDFIKNYEYYFIVDDDICLNVYEINELFSIMKKFDLWMMQPCFSRIGKISHGVTRRLFISNLFMSYTNFVEINTSFMSKYAVEKCAEIYDSRLVGWGIDYLFIWHLGKEHKRKYAVVNRIECVNPKDEQKKDREIDKMMSMTERKAVWEKIMKEKNIEQWKQRYHAFVYENNGAISISKKLKNTIVTS